MYTEISFKKLEHIVQEIEMCESSLKRQLEQLLEVQNKLKSMDSEAVQLIIKSIQTRNDELLSAVQKVKLLKISLSKIIELYCNCEDKIIQLEDEQLKKLDTNIELRQLYSLNKALKISGISFK